MRGKINQLAEGVFEYEKDFPNVTPNELKMVMNIGSVCEASLCITAESGDNISGIVTAKSPYIYAEEENFSGKENIIKIKFYGKDFKPGEIVRGDLMVISDKGLKRIPYHVTIAMPACDIESGSIRDLFHFTNLCKDNPKEALNIFQDRMFEKVFLYNDEANSTLYRGMMESSNKKTAMEEFLIAIHKKLPVRLDIPQNAIKVDVSNKKLHEVINIHKDSWGYSEYQVKAVDDYIIPDVSSFDTFDFHNDIYPLGFTVDSNKIFKGNNNTKIIIKGIRESYEIGVVVSGKGRIFDNYKSNIKTQKIKSDLTESYLNFCMEKTDINGYISALSGILSDDFDRESLFYKLYNIHLAILKADGKKVEYLLNELEPEVAVVYRERPEVYAAYYYLKGLWKSDEDDIIKDCLEKIKRCSSENPDVWQLKWFLLYLDSEYNYYKKRINLIISEIKNGCNSPVMYFEAMHVLNENPALLTELSKEYAQILHWGTAKKCITKEVALRYVYLVGHVRIYSGRIYEDMKSLYRMFEDDEILTTLCKILIKGDKTDEDAFEWYSLAVEKNIKINDLYEYYIYSLKPGKEHDFGKNMLMYFMYDNRLTTEKRAMLYTYIVRNKEKDIETYNDYVESMRDFTLNRLKKGIIDENMAVLYEEFVNDEILDASNADSLAKVMFCHRITCTDPRMTGVYVRHPELEKEEYVPFKNQKAVVNIYNNHAGIFLADDNGNRYAASVRYTSNKLLRLNHLAEKCYEYNKDNTALLIHIYCKNEQMNITGDKAVDVIDRILGLKDITDKFRKKVYTSLINYYYDNEMMDVLDDMLENLDWRFVLSGYRNKFINYLALRKFYDKAMEGIRMYGFNQINAKKLLMISEKIFTEVLDDDSMLIKMAWYMFERGKYSEDTIEYLCKYYSGTIDELTDIWQVAKDNGFESGGMEERILAQSLFTGEMNDKIFDIFYFYQENGEDKQLIIAFKKWMAYEYLFRGRKLPDDMFGYYFRDVQIKGNLLGLIAVLKYFSTCDKLSAEEINFADYHVNKLYDRKIVFPFYKDFYGKFALPVHIMDEYYIEYIANPKYEVVMYYRILTENEKDNIKYKSEKMRNVFQGIRVKEFVLFQDEILEYYVVEHRPEGDVKSRINRVRYDESMDNSRAGSRYHTLNLMMIAQEMNDEVTLLDMMEEYATERCVAKEIFIPII